MKNVFSRSFYAVRFRTAARYTKRRRGRVQSTLFTVYFVRLLISPVVHLRTFSRKFSNLDLFLKILPLKDDELGSQKCRKNGGSPTSFLREHAQKNT